MACEYDLCISQVCRCLHACHHLLINSHTYTHTHTIYCVSDICNPLLQCKDTSFSNETFLTALKTSDNIEELQAVKEKVDQDIVRQRSKDTGGDDGMKQEQFYGFGLLI